MVRLGVSRSIAAANGYTPRPASVERIGTACSTAGSPMVGLDAEGPGARRRRSTPTMCWATCSSRSTGGRAGALLAARRLPAPEVLRSEARRGPVGVRARSGRHSGAGRRHEDRGIASEQRDHRRARRRHDGFGKGEQLRRFAAGQPLQQHARSATRRRGWRSGDRQSRLRRTAHRQRRQARLDQPARQMALRRLRRGELARQHALPLEVGDNRQRLARLDPSVAARASGREGKRRLSSRRASRPLKCVEVRAADVGTGAMASTVPASSPSTSISSLKAAGGGLPRLHRPAATRSGLIVGAKLADLRHGATPMDTSVELPGRDTAAADPPRQRAVPTIAAICGSILDMDMQEGARHRRAAPRGCARSRCQAVVTLGCCSTTLPGAAQTFAEILKEGPRPRRRWRVPAG